MSSDLFIYDDNSLFRCSAFPPDVDLFSDPYSPFSDSAIDVLRAFSDPLEESHFLANSSPLTHQLIDLHLLPNAAGAENAPPVNTPDVKDEQYYAGRFSDPVPRPGSFTGPENAEKLLQRSCSIGGFGFQTRLDALMASQNLQNQSIGCPETDFFSSQIRRVFSTGDLQNSGQRSSLEDASFRVGRYSAEERREKISKYRAKRTQRNFNKTIKYACRKTLADNRPRIRGRFARNEEAGEIPKAACSATEDDDDDFWMEGLHGGGGEEGALRGKQYGNSYGQMQFQYCGF